MTPGSQHPLRCETCKNIECEYHHLKADRERTRRWNGKNLRHVDFTPAYFTEEKGCASHSDSSHPAASEQEIRVDERDRVLDEIKSKIFKLQSAFAAKEMEDGISTRMSERFGVCRSVMQDVLKLIETLRRQPPGGNNEK